MPTKEQLAARAARNRLQWQISRRIAKNFAEYLDTIEANVGKVGTEIMMREAREVLRHGLTSTLNDSAQQSVELAKNFKAAEFAPLLSRAKRLLATAGASAAETERVTSLARVSAYFGGGLDRAVIDKVWNKVWPDALNVDDRIKRLSARATEYAENVIRQGISEGTSAQELKRILRDHFEAEGIEAKAAFRLAAHTTNMTYEAANAAISMDVNFVTGIRIVRGMYGPASESCEICYEHGGDDYKEYYKGNGDNLAIMADQPPYHANCNCGTEDITETAEQFVANALAGS